VVGSDFGDVDEIVSICLLTYRPEELSGTHKPRGRLWGSCRLRVVELRKQALWLQVRKQALGQVALGQRSA